MDSNKPRYKIEDLIIDPIIFSQGFVPKCNLTICKGECCNLGVYIDVNFREKILSYKSDIINVMSENQPKNPDLWFGDEIIQDSDFISGFAVSINTYNNINGNEQCIFKDSNNFCSLQVAAENLGFHKWDLKPTHCILYPLTINNTTLTYDIEHSENLSYCGYTRKENFTKIVFNAMYEEIKYIFGENAIKIINEYLKSKV